MKGKKVLKTLSSLNCLPTRLRSTKSASAAPKPSPRSSTSDQYNLTSTQQENLRETHEHFQRQTASLTIAKTTVHPSGQIIDWIPINSQGTIATAPPAPPSPSADPSKPANRPKAELELAGAPRGPEGTVPVPRQNPAFLSPQQTLSQRLAKRAPPGLGVTTEDDAGVHWYASSAQAVSNHGGAGTFSVFSPYVQSSSDFSLIQTAVIKTSAPLANNAGTSSQTVEAGWINYPAQIGSAHLFTYYTTNGYASEGNNLSGWNRDVAGWVQTDSSIFPGTVFSPNSTDGGTQYEINIRYYLYQGNWWLWVSDRYIGYYPGSLFSANRSNASATLAGGSDQINFYGEIYNSESAETTTDMGSGRFAETGWTHSAYIREIVYINTSDADTTYNGSGQLIVSDTSRYDMTEDFSGTSSWGSYMYLGGPGAGGVTRG